MTDLSWLLGEQWPVSPTDLAAEADRAAIVLLSPTLCARSLEVEAVVGRARARRIALLFDAYRQHGESQHDIGEPIARSKELSRQGWEIERVEDSESSDFVRKLRNLLVGVRRTDTILVDITGLPVAALAIMVRLFRGEQQAVTWIYAEPGRYVDGAQTEFARGLEPVSPIRGFAAQGSAGEEGALVVLAGYDSAALKAVTDYRKGANPRYLIVPFPSLQADMYQESALKVERVKEYVGVDMFDQVFARRVPAFDAWGVVEQLDWIRRKTVGAVLSVAPLSTKAQTLGVLLWWSRLGEGRELVSIVVPRYRHLLPRVSEGIGKVWRYKEFLDDRHT